VKHSPRESVTLFFDFIEKNLKPATLWPGMLLVIFLASLLASLAVPDRRAIVLWFPDSRMTSGSRARPELRYVSSERDIALMAASVVEELLLGPLFPESRPITVPDARLLSSIRSKKTLYVDVSNDILFGRLTASGVYEAPLAQPEVVLGYIERSLHWNFPFFRIVLTVEGQEPFWTESEVAEGT
jgi:hypothetical protein